MSALEDAQSERDIYERMIMNSARIDHRVSRSLWDGLYRAHDRLKQASREDFRASVAMNET